ncbi:MAG: hypothetical protein JWM10_891, partial [Myxococcaceae bacterium]|nr:hypothetical protein [Myxococcaceae bacterium]
AWPPGAAGEHTCPAAGAAATITAKITPALIGAAQHHPTPRIPVRKRAVHSLIRPLLPVALLAACGSEPASFDAAVPDRPLAFDVPNTRDVPRVDRGPTPEVVDLTDVPALTDGGMRDGPCAEALPDGLRFGTEGGRVPYNTTYTLGAPRRFLLERTYSDASPARCETTIPACGAADDVTVDTLAAALASSDVAAAFAAAGAGDAGTLLYGVDERPLDGALFFLERGGRFVYVGAPCRTGSGAQCLTAPVGVQRLVDVLSALRDQESRRPVCAAALGDGGA